jgi:hypothetical protein
MDALTTGLVVAVIGLVFKDQIKNAASAIKDKLQRPKKLSAELEYGQKWHDSLYNHVGRMAHTTTPELNHIKGQLQELLQEQKKPLTFHSADIVAIAADTKALFERLNMVYSETVAVKETLSATAAPKQALEDPTPIYLQALGNLAKGSSQLLERQERIEQKLIDIVTVLKSLT